MFKKRQINIQIADKQGNTVDLSGYRVHAMIDNPGGISAFASLEIAIFGMSLDLMNQYSTIGFDQIATKNFKITVFAGDEGTGLAQVFKGSIIRSRIEINQPDNIFVASAVSGYFDKASTGSANSYPNAANVEDIIKTLAESVGYEFVNKNGAHAVLQNQYLYGDPISQIQQIAKACNLPVVFENEQVIIFPNDGKRDDVIVEVSPETGLVGYPRSWEAGVKIKTEFNPLLANGRTVKLTSQIPIYNGSWPIQSVFHELATEFYSEAPWFSDVVLSPSNYVPKN